MAHCHNCGEEIQGGMKFCPHCGQDQSVVIPQDQRIPTEDVEGVPPPPSFPDQQGTPQQRRGMSRAWRVVLVAGGGLGLLLLALIVVAIVSGAPNNTATNTAESGGGQEEAEEEKESPSKGKKAKKGTSDSLTVAVGEAAELEDRTLTVAEVERGYTPQNRFSKTESGNEFMRVLVRLTNTSNRPIDYSRIHFEVQDSDGVQKRASSVPDLPRELDSGDLAPDGTVEGNLVFEVPRNDNNLALIYTTNMFSGETITVRPLQ
jgi:Domain of unknown function (DUF4352)/zinc-ribbon domain